MTNQNTLEQITGSPCPWTRFSLAEPLVLAFTAGAVERHHKPLPGSLLGWTCSGTLVSPQGEPTPGLGASAGAGHSEPRARKRSGGLGVQKGSPEMEDSTLSAVPICVGMVLSSVCGYVDKPKSKKQSTNKMLIINLWSLLFGDNHAKKSVRSGNKTSHFFTVWGTDVLGKIS